MDSAGGDSSRLLDVAGGTGDIAFRFLKRAGSGHATVLDLTEPMLIEGRKRAAGRADLELLLREAVEGINLSGCGGCTIRAVSCQGIEIAHGRDRIGERQ